MSSKSVTRRLAALRAHETMRARRQIFDPEKHSLVDYVRITGGLKPDPELREVLDDSTSRMLVVRSDGDTLDGLTWRIWEEAGFISPDASQDDVLEALAADLRAKRRGDDRSRVWSRYREGYEDRWWIDEREAT